MKIKLSIHPENPGVYVAKCGTREIHLIQAIVMMKLGYLPTHAEICDCFNQCKGQYDRTMTVNNSVLDASGIVPKTILN